MKFATSLLLFSLFIVGIYCADTDAGIPEHKIVTDIPEAIDKKKTTTKTSTTTSSTTPSTTTSSTTTSSTTTTPTTIPPSTTQSTTTTSSTTPKPTTTTAAPTTTVAPNPKKDPELAKYFVKENNVTCILVQFAAQLNISLGNNSYRVMNLPGSDDIHEPFKQAKGSCGKNQTIQYIVIEWPEEGGANTLNMSFYLNKTKKPEEFSLNEIVFNLSSKIDPSSESGIQAYHDGSILEIPKERSYHCTKVQKLNLTKTENPKSELVGTFSISRVLIEAFHSSNNNEYSTNIDCEGINTPDIVPIAVGIALIALVVVVLIAYLVGRRRAQSRGYVSM